MQSGQTKNGIGMTVSACLWLGLFPLLQFGTYRTITRDKWICMLILAGVTLIGFLADLLSRRLARPRLLPLLAGGALLGWMVLSALTSPYPGNPWWIGAGRREGLATQLCYLGLFFCFSFARVRRMPVLLSAGVGLLLFGTVVVLQRAGGNPLGLYPGKYSYAVEPFFQGTIGHVDMCTGYLLILCGLFLPAASDSLRRLRILRAEAQERADSFGQKKKALAWTCLFLCLTGICVWLFVSMEVRFGLVTFAALLVWTLIRILPKRYRLPCLLLIIICVLLFVWFYPGQVSTLYELHEVLHGRPQIMFGSGRIGVWTYCAKLLRQGDHLLLGTGPDTFAIRFNAFLQQYYADHPEAEHLIEYFDNPHNDYLALLLNCGIPALLLFLLLVIGGCFGAPAWRDGVLCYGIQVLLSFSVCLVAPMFWVVLGLSLASRPACPD